MRVETRTQYQRKKRVLVVGDSLAHNTNFRKVEIGTRSTIKTAKAYSSIYDDAAKYKHKNISDVTKKELEEASFNHLVMAAPTVDISNLNTKNVRAKDNTDEFKERVGISCKNMMKVAQDALKNHPELEKVTIMNHAPRYDTSDVDPVGLKSILANFANAYFLELWLDSPMKNKIVIGSHSLDCSGEERTKRYTDDRSKRYDGVHFLGGLGKSVYTESVMKILLSSFQTQSQASAKLNPAHRNRDEEKKQRKYSSVLTGEPIIRTQNRFSPLGGLSENC